jgi:xanthine dehydrogenase accessory factor
MRDVLAELKSEWELGNTAGLATVVRTFKSAPRPAGASVLVTRDGRAVGSVSGGCVEGAVYELAREMEHTGTPVLQRYGVSDDDAFSVGLTCGGILNIFVEPVSPATFPQLEAVWADIGAGRPVAVATVIKHPSPDWVGRRLMVHPADTDGSLGHPPPASRPCRG